MRVAAWTRVGLLLLAMILGAAICAITVFAVGDATVPPTLSPPEAPDSLPVVTQDFNDSRQTPVAVSTGSAVRIMSPREGLVTTATCSTGEQWRSGQTSVSIDGVPLVNLSTSTPLWRDLEVGTQGADAVAVKDELKRLGYATSDGDRISRVDTGSMRSLLSAVGASSDLSGIPASSFVWLPSPEVLIKSCDAYLGQRISGSDVLIEIQPPLSLHIEPPAELVQGDRQLRIDDVVIPLNADLTPIDPGQVLALASTKSYRAAIAEVSDESPNVMLTGSVELVSPVPVSALPPSAVRLDSPTLGCVDSDVGVVGVLVASSELGRTLVVFHEDEEPSSVATTPPRSCE